MLAYKDRPKGKDNNSKGTCNKIEVVISILIEWLIDQQQTKESIKRNSLKANQCLHRRTSDATTLYASSN